MQHKSKFIRVAVVVALICAVLMPVGQPVRAQDAPTPVALDDAGFGVAEVAALAAQGQAEFTLDLLAGDRVTMDLQGEVLDKCLQLFGGYGYMAEYPIARAFVDARLNRIAGGSMEVMKHIIGKDLAKRY